MENFSSKQLAELLIGIARAQQVIVEAVESARPGFKMTHLTPVLHAAAKLRNTNHVATLTDLPARLLLQCQGRVGPDIELVVRDLEEMLSAKPPDMSAAPEVGSLDMT
ncbi:MAG: hypothetical protein Q8K18_05570 [Burkholderiales bacterium]|nr:hypothetical protein [Burkholderiales bacterium]